MDNNNDALISDNIKLIYRNKIAKNMIDILHW